MINNLFPPPEVNFVTQPHQLEVVTFRICRTSAAASIEYGQSIPLVHPALTMHVNFLRAHHVCSAEIKHQLWKSKLFKKYMVVSRRLAGLRELMRGSKQL
jgi:hypothetical protein